MKKKKYYEDHFIEYRCQNTLKEDKYKIKHFNETKIDTYVMCITIPKSQMTRMTFMALFFIK